MTLKSILYLSSSPPQKKMGSDSDRARSNHSPLEGESKLHSNFGGGSEDYITNSNSSFVDNIIYPSPKAPSTTPSKGGAMQIENCTGGAMQIVLDLITPPLYGRGQNCKAILVGGQKSKSQTQIRVVLIVFTPPRRLRLRPSRKINFLGERAI